MSGHKGLDKWFKQDWVDIGSKKKGGGFAKCGRSKQKNKPGSPDNPITLKKGGFVARGCGAIMSNRKKKTRFA